MELGLITFADMKPETLSGRAINGQQRIKDLMEEIQLADQLGLDVFGVGEHHRPDYAVSSPAVILGAAAMVTYAVPAWFIGLAAEERARVRDLISRRRQRG